ncbi:hypothetical protein MMC12_004033 [Toensbergia leucococca]|nr:hypothetical protein [Toensbergia leucococca]
MNDQQQYRHEQPSHEPHGSNVHSSPTLAWSQDEGIISSHSAEPQPIISDQEYGNTSYQNLRQSSVSSLGDTNGQRESYAAYASSFTQALPSYEDAVSNPASPDNVGWGQQLQESIQTGVDTLAGHRGDRVASHRKVQPVENTGKEFQRNNTSFYWHSPRSSLDEAEDTKQMVPATPENRRTAPGVVESLPTTETAEYGYADVFVPAPSLLQPVLGYNASALGFGGPSDWEHFGDYAAEEVDDTELYSRTKPKNEAVDVPESVELPTNSSPVFNLKQGFRSTPSALESRFQLPPASTSLRTNPQKSSSLEELVPKPRPSDDRTQFAVAEQTIEPAMDPTPSECEGSGASQENLPRQSLGADLDESIRAWSQNSVNEPRGEPIPAHDDAPFEDNGLDDVETSSPPLEARLKPGSPGSLKVSASFLKIPNALEGGRGTRPHASIKGSALDDQQDSSKEQNQSESSRVIQLDVAAHNAIMGVNETKDPYANMNSWARASLDRYALMLTEESNAMTDLEKMGVFMAFATRESRLRADLYGTKSEPLNVEQTAFLNSPTKRAHSRTSSLRDSAESFIVPIDTDSQHSPQPDVYPARQSSLPEAKDTRQAKSVINSDQHQIDRPAADESYVLVDSPNDIQYSPGGRPKVIRTSKTEGGSLFDEESVTSPSNVFLKGIATKDMAKSDNENHSPSSDAPTAIDFLTGNDPKHSKVFTFDSSADSTVARPDTTQTVYTPFRYNETHPETKDYSASRQSTYRPYAALRLGSLDSGIKVDKEQHLKRRDTFDSPAAVQKVHEETVIGSPKSGELSDIINPNSLLTVLPQSGITIHESLELSQLRRSMDAIIDDFSFIHKSVVTWDAAAKQVREQCDRDRHSRQVDSEQRIDGLFNDHEIGYGDISDLEAEFKRSEAVRKADEDRVEYQTFLSEVFNIVWTRLHYEIDELNPLYHQCLSRVNNALAGKNMFEECDDRLALAPTMNTSLALHQKLEIRHQKAFEAVLERDRRLKKTEVSPWYALGNIIKVKQLEKQFEVAEKKAILEYCRQRDERANRLMDVLDHNTLRGVGINQDYMETIMKSVRTLTSEIALDPLSSSDGLKVPLEEVVKAKAVTTSIATSSEQIVQTFHVADMLLNAAEYEVSVASARVTNAEAAVLTQLIKDRAVEDQKLVKDLEHRLSLIREASRRTLDEIAKLISFLGVQDGKAETSQTDQAPMDRSHDERLQKALDDAKRRNALKNRSEDFS